MERYNTEQRLLFVKTYYRYWESITLALRKCRIKYEQHLSLARETLKLLVKKFQGPAHWQIE